MNIGKPFYDADGESIEVDIMFDWKESADDIMEAVNTALKAHSLELLSHETESDFYAFTIVKIKKGKK